MLSFLLCAIGALPSDVSAAERLTIREIAKVYARSMVTTGQTPGIGVAIIVGNNEPRFFSYGNAVPGSGHSPPKPFSPDLLFEIGSNTKVFTTNLLGQRVYTGALSLDRPLSSFPVHLGTLKPLTRQITLEQLADFTAGIADVAPPCTKQRRIPGCLPSGRPTIRQYKARDFVHYFQFIVPRDWTVTPPPRVDALPAPYNYSDFSVGLLGLLLAAPPRQPIRNATVHRWYEDVRANILQPLGMRNTFLFIPDRAADRKAPGYHVAVAQAEVTRGAVSRIRVENGGSFYTHPPLVRITGGGGSGAAAVARLDGDSVGRITVARGGSGYIPPARVLFNFGGSSSIAKAEVIVSDGRVAGIAIRDRGAGYQHVPKVTIRGGRRGGRAATATAHLVNGQVSYVTVDDPGAGYVQPLSVHVAPGGTSHNNIPVWAAAGALSSSLRDMAKFAQAALGRVNKSVPEQIVKGFEIAQRPYACQGSHDPSLAACKPGVLRSGLAWQIQPPDPANGVPAIVSKGGGLLGYWSYISLMPERGLGVVVFMNTNPEDKSSVPEDVQFVAGNILYALFYESQRGRSE